MLAKKNTIKKQIILIYILVFMLILSLIGLFIVIRMQNRLKPEYLPVKQYQHRYIPLEKIECDLTKKEAKQIVDSLYNVKYDYKEVNIIDDNGSAGYTNNRQVLVLNSLNVEDYIVVLSHELVHIKYNTFNETFVEYTSIVTMYESDIDIIQKISLNRARLIIAGCYANTDYDCGYYLLEYFENKQVKL